jgi:hypothetical protein
VIIFEFIGYCIETAGIALWRTRLVQTLRKWWLADQDWSETIAISLIALTWLALCVVGLA